MSSSAPIKVMVVDDSFFMRKALEKILTAAGDMQICDAVGTGEAALEHLDDVCPDLITMDVEMPGMGGIAAVREIMARRRIPIVMLSAFTARGTETTIRALENGAADFVAKPGRGINDIDSIAIELVEKIRQLTRPAPRVVAPPIAATAEMRPRPGTIGCIAIGISTGGPAALSTVLARLPAGFPVPVLIAQHMPVGFTKALAERLDVYCPLEVLEAEEGMRVRPGRVIIGVAGRQLRIVRRGDQLVTTLDDAGSSALYRPSVNLLMHSVAECYGRAGLGIIMTGMGSDGVEGLAALKARGGLVYGQDARSSTVYGMPRAAAQAGLLDRVLSLGEIGDAMLEAGRRET